jgi:hypothetical protein
MGKSTGRAIADPAYFIKYAQPSLKQTYMAEYLALLRSS